MFLLPVDRNFRCPLHVDITSHFTDDVVDESRVMTYYTGEKKHFDLDMKDEKFDMKKSYPEKCSVKMHR